MTGRSMIGYAFVSGICLLLSNAILITMDAAGYSWAIAVMVSYSIVVVAGYVLHSMISFAQPMGPASFGRYAIAMSVNIPLAFLTVWFWHKAMALPMLWAAPLATACSMVANYILTHWAVSNRDNGLANSGNNE